MDNKNVSADNMPRKDILIEDGGFHDDFLHGPDFEKHLMALPDAGHFERLVCSECGGKSFEVISRVGHYQTVARCDSCGSYYVVHDG